MIVAHTIHALTASIEMCGSFEVGGHAVSSTVM